MLKQFETVENLLEHIDEVSGKKLKEKLEEYKEQAVMSKQLATILVEAPIDVSSKDLAYEGPHMDQVTSLYKELGFQTLLERLGEAPETGEQVEVEALEVKKMTDVTDEMLTDHAALVVEQLGDNYHEADLIGFAIHNENGAFFITKEDALQSDAFKQWVQDETKKKWVFDSKRAVVALRWHDVDLKVSITMFCSLPMSSILRNPMRTSQVWRRNTVLTSHFLMKKCTEKEQSRRFHLKMN